jgi:DNA primase
MDLKEEIKSRIKILDLVYEFGLQVYRKNFIKSIYKDERTPSMKIYSETNTYKCYSTGIQGDVIKFYMDFNKIAFKEALNELAIKAGVEEVKSQKSKVNGQKLEVRSQKSEGKGQEVRSQKAGVRTGKIVERRVMILKSEMEFFDERAGIYEYMMGTDRNQSEIRAVADLMNERKEKQSLVYESLEKYCYGVDEETLEYLLGKNRGLKPEMIKKFRLFSLNNSKFTTEFLKDCFSSDDLRISGLLNTKGNFVFSYHKLIIPYVEHNKITYLRGRTLEGIEGKRQKAKGISKYISLNNFAGMLPLKRFYNVDVLKSICPNEKLIVTEGEFDCEIMEQEGFRAIGIPGVTNIPEEQIHLIKDYDIHIAFDNDEPGINAMHRLVRLLNKPVKAIKLKHHKDLTELINERNGRNF